MTQADAATTPVVIASAPLDSPPSPWVGRARQAMPWLIGLVITMSWDRAVWLNVSVDHARVESMEKHNGLYMFLYQLGTIWPWLMVAATLALLDWARDETGRTFASLRRAGLLVAATGGAGLAAEVVKLVVRRERPNMGDGYYHFRSFLDGPLDGSNLGMPSSHAAVAFGAAFALSAMLPRATPVFLIAAFGCAAGRVVAGAHFFSDVYVGVIVAYAAWQAVYALDLKLSQRTKTLPAAPASPAPPIP